MRIRRSPQSSNAIGAITDQRTIDNSEEEWEPGHIYWFNGTIDTDGKRHTDIGVEVELEDIVALFNALVKYYIACSANRKAALDNVQEAISHKWDAPGVSLSVLDHITHMVRSCEEDPDRPDWEPVRPSWFDRQPTE